jgi:hypothetical protein
LTKKLARNLFLVLLSSFLWTACSPSEQGKGTVYIEKTGDKFQLIRNGEPFIIKGVSGEVRLKELVDIGGNCIRTYDTTNLGAILDEAQSLNIAVIAGIWLPKSNSKWFYPNDNLVAETALKLKAFAKKYSNHPALLSWCLGNELIYYDFKDWGFARGYNQILDSLKSGDPNHPVGTALANYGDKAILNFGLKIRNIDLVYVNTFGRLNQLEADRARWTWLLDKPFVVGEFGENGPWESDGTVWGAPGEINSSQKAERLAAIYDSILPKDNPAFLGSLAFFWGWRQEQTHTWFNVFSQEGEKNEMYFKLAEVFGKELKSNRPPKVGLLSIDSIFYANKLLLDPSTPHFAKVFASDPEKDSLNYHWSVRTEDWFFVKGDLPPAALENTVLSPNTKEGKISFNSPSKPGPYRLFVKITDGHGNFGSVNLPFYVVPE